MIGEGWEKGMLYSSIDQDQVQVQFFCLQGVNHPISEIIHRFIVYGHNPIFQNRINVTLAHAESPSRRLFRFVAHHRIDVY
jgi:hypothetical protein